MATWLTHLRVADRLFDKIEICDSSLFYAGSIAPDTNISPDISHWCVNGDKTTCDVYCFYCKYVFNNDKSSGYEFYLGYYIHLLTDILWQKQIMEPLKQYDKVYIKNVKESWKIVDSNFLSSQKNYRPIIAISDTSKYERQWFDYYYVSQIKELVEYIIKSSKVDNHENAYTDIKAEREIDQFIEETSIHIFTKLKETIAQKIR